MNDFTEFAPATGMDVQGLRTQGYGIVNYGPGDDRKIVLFYNKAVLNPRKSREQGAPIHDNHVYVQIGEPGETNLQRIDRPATDNDIRRFRVQWEQFSNNQKQVPEGTPIEMLWPTDPSRAAMLKSYGVHTIQQLAHLSAQGLSTIGMGAQEWANKAKTYLEQAERGVGFHQLKEVEDKLRNENDVLKTQIANLRAQLEVAVGRLNQAANMPSLMQPIERTAVDTQTIMINNTQERDFTLPELDQPKRRGRPPRIKETA